MATWSREARSDWATGMGSAASNGLNAMEAAALRRQVEAWADSPGAMRKVFRLGKSNNVDLGVKVAASDGEINTVDFGELTQLLG